MSKSASINTGRGGIVVDSETQRQVPGGGECARAEMQIGLGFEAGQAAPREALECNGICGGGCETARRQALEEGASAGFAIGD